MPASTTRSRPFTDAERAELERLLRDLGRARVWLRGTFWLWLFSVTLALLVWWIARKLTGSPLGWDSDGRLTIVVGIALGCAAFSALANWRRLQRQPDLTLAIRADLAAGVVNEEHYEFSEAKRLQEIEHGGLICFLKSSNGQAYVLYDRESQELGARGENPLSSSFAPRTKLLVVRAANSRFVFSSEFDGPALHLPEPADLLLDDWPEDEEYCPVPWAQLEAHFGQMKKSLR